MKPKNKDHLTAVLTYHAVPGEMMSADLVGQQLASETAQGITVEIEATADVEMSNDVIHVVDAAVLPMYPSNYRTGPRTMTNKPTIAEIVLQSGGEFDGDGSDFDILLQALQATDLLDVVADPHADFTVFAPTDDAFIALARDLGAEIEDGDDAGAFQAIVGTLTDLAPDGDPIPLLKDVLLYHVSPGGQTVCDLQAEGTIDTALGVTFDVQGTELNDQDPDIENPEFIEGLTDIHAANGVIQGIDRVLLPIDLPEPPPSDDNVADCGADSFDFVATTDIDGPADVPAYDDALIG